MSLFSKPKATGDPWHHPIRATVCLWILFLLLAGMVLDEGQSLVDL